jgi:transposase-like protein
MLRKNLAKLTRTQRQQLVTELTAEERQFASVAVIESARAQPKCPHCGAERIVKNGTADGLQRFKCRACAKTFNALTGAALAPSLPCCAESRSGASTQWRCRDGRDVLPALQRSGLARKARKRSGKAAKRGLSQEQVPVRVARDRSGATVDFILDVDDVRHVVLHSSHSCRLMPFSAPTAAVL